MKSKEIDPNGKEVEVKLAMSRWRNLIKPILKATGYKLIGFNPGYLITDKGSTIDLPVCFVKSINKAMKKKNKTRVVYDPEANYWLRL